MAECLVMMNGKTGSSLIYTRTPIMKCKFLYILYAVIIVSVWSWALAGNQEMIENRTEELDQLNKEIIEQIPDLPKDAKISIKARVKPHADGFCFDIDKKKISPIKKNKSGDNLKKTGTYNLDTDNVKATDIKEEEFKSNIKKNNSVVKKQIIFGNKQIIDATQEGEGESTNDIKKH